MSRDQRWVSLILVFTILFGVSVSSMDRDTEETLLSGDETASKLSIGLNIGRFSASTTLGAGKPQISASYTTKGGSQFSLDINKPVDAPPPVPGVPQPPGAVPQGPVITQDGINVNSVMSKIDAIVEALVEPQDQDDEILMENFALLLCRKMQIEFDRFSLIHQVGCKGTRVECEEGFFAARSEFGRAAQGIFKEASKQCRFMWGGVEDTEDDGDDEDGDDDLDPLSENCKDRPNGKSECGAALRAKEKNAKKAMADMVAQTLKRKSEERAAESAKLRQMEAERKLTEERTKFIQQQRRKLARQSEIERKHRQVAMARAAGLAQQARALDSDPGFAPGPGGGGGPHFMGHKKKCHHKHGKKCCDKKHPPNYVHPLDGDDNDHQNSFQGSLPMGAAPNAAGDTNFIQTQATTNAASMASANAKAKTKAESTTEDFISKIKEDFDKTQKESLEEVEQEAAAAKAEAAKVEASMAAVDASNAKSSDDEDDSNDDGDDAATMAEDEKRNREMIANLKKAENKGV